MWLETQRQPSGASEGAEISRDQLMKTSSGDADFLWQGSDSVNSNVLRFAASCQLRFLCVCVYVHVYS